MEKIYLDSNKKILEMLEKGAKLTETDEEKTMFSYRGKNVVVSTPYLRRLISPGDYGERTIDSLTGIGIGLAVNTAREGSSYLSQLSQNKEYNSLLKRRKPRKPKRKFD